MENPTATHKKFMLLALKQAKKARQKGDMPFGAVIVKDAQIVVAATYNSEHISADVTAHAELKAVRQACRKLRRRDLSDCILYSSNEPCHMCATAAFIARIPHIFYALSRDDLPHLFRARKIRINELLQDVHHPAQVTGGILQNEAFELFDGINKPFGLPKFPLK